MQEKQLKKEVRDLKCKIMYVSVFKW